ncbi:hypothetical protein DV737_g1188, partial [Chaetothyriales sp. CBS 132003]
MNVPDGIKMNVHDGIKTNVNVHDGIKMNVNVPIAPDTEPVDDALGEFEYQYDETETETFLVDLDLTSLNGPLAAAARGAREETNAEAAEGDRVQIVDLASGNPIVLYRGQMYSCSWVDMIGTSMFFTQPLSGDEVHGAVARPDVDFALLDTSHIKLVGQQASLVPRAIVDGTALPGFSSTNWRTNIARRKQADFLDRLMQAKRRRGETDVVPTVGERKGKAVYRLDGDTWAGLSAEQRVKLSNLGGRVVKGDARAVAALREMYSELPGVVLSNGEGDSQ